MKVIAINHEQFYDKTQAASIKITRAINANIESPIFIGDSIGLSVENNLCEDELPVFSPLKLTDFLTENFTLPISDCYEILSETKNNRLSLDLRGINIHQMIAIAQVFAKTAFALNNKPTIYILLVDNVAGADMAEQWYKAFYIEPYPSHLLMSYLNRSLFRMRLRAFVLRYFGSKIERILRRLWHLSQKIRRR